MYVSTEENNIMSREKNVVIGAMAHVDAGKTTLSESMLYLSGNIRKLGRVDHGNTFLDTYALERARGITIFSKQARINLQHMNITLLDTPGHVDFSAEMERTLQVLDYAILVISGADGVQGHTKTLWYLLSKYRVPVFLFVNKMDQDGTDKDTILAHLKKELNSECIDFSNDQSNEFFENIATCDENLLEQFLETSKIKQEDINRFIRTRKIFPCYFGSALKLTGVEAFLHGLETYTSEPWYPEEFGAKVFKIARDEQGNRLTYLKITGGVMKVKQVLTNQQEKINQIRIYSGEKYETVNELDAGNICAVTGLTQTRAGEGLGIEQATGAPLLAPVLNYKILLPDDCDAAAMLPKFRLLEEEIPELHIVWEEETKSIQVQIMGEVQTEVLKCIVFERFGVEIEFGTGSIVYKETIAEPVEGVGHFEPLRHYAEVHLLLEPLEQGSGLQFATDCSEDLLDRNWQRLVLTHLMEKEHKGVLVGAAITDMRITLIAGRAHQKHTEGGDFRQATYRAVRQGLKQATSILLEPYYEFRLEIPETMLGRAMLDIENMYGTCKIEQVENGLTVLTGNAPVSTMQNYQREVTAYTRGNGRLSYRYLGYGKCHNSEQVIAEVGYDSERDLENPTGSVFCAHGAGFTVSWDCVKDYMHLEGLAELNQNRMDALQTSDFKREEEWIGTDEIDQILNRTFYANRKDGLNSTKKRYTKRIDTSLEPVVRRYKTEEPKEEYLLVDGYNVLFADEELRELANINMDGAAQKLMDILCNYQGLYQCNVILVFDAYKLKDHPTELLEYHNILVVYTKEAETADQYIEKFAHNHSSKYRITVATSDGVEQMIIRSKGCGLLSARDFWKEMKETSRLIQENYLNSATSGRTYLFDHVSDHIANKIERIRNGEN